jgi:rhamnose utilization protein RhaD (predicted bifunctional aldolase and dehydrogenase)
VPAELEQIVALSRALGDPALDLAILGEGNTSLRTGEGTMLVKASGASLASVTEADFVELETAPLTALLDDPAADDVAVAQAFAPVEARTGRRPSVEAMLHAVCLELGGAEAVGHTHPVPVVALLCSRHAEALATEMLFPDQIVVLGRRPLFVPYVDPGLALARRVRDELATHVARYGEPPKVIYLGNHGLFALGATPEHVLQITAMAVKASRVLAGALAMGGVSPLADGEADRIDARPDEHYRRAALARARTGETGDA